MFKYLLFSFVSDILLLTFIDLIFCDTLMYNVSIIITTYLLQNKSLLSTSVYILPIIYVSSFAIVSKATEQIFNKIFIQ